MKSHLSTNACQRCRRQGQRALHRHRDHGWLGEAAIAVGLTVAVAIGGIVAPAGPALAVCTTLTPTTDAVVVCDGSAPNTGTITAPDGDDDNISVHLTTGAITGRITLGSGATIVTDEGTRTAGITVDDDADITINGELRHSGELHGILGTAGGSTITIGENAFIGGNVSTNGMSRFAAINLEVAGTDAGNTVIVNGTIEHVVGTDGVYSGIWTDTNNGAHSSLTTGADSLIRSSEGVFLDGGAHTLDLSGQIEAFEGNGIRHNGGPVRGDIDITLRGDASVVLETGSDLNDVINSAFALDFSLNLLDQSRLETVGSESSGISVERADSINIGIAQGAGIDATLNGIVFVLEDRNDSVSRSATIVMDGEIDVDGNGVLFTAGELNVASGYTADIDVGIDVGGTITAGNGAGVAALLAGGVQYDLEVSGTVATSGTGRDAIELEGIDYEITGAATTTITIAAGGSVTATDGAGIRVVPNGTSRGFVGWAGVHTHVIVAGTVSGSGEGIILRDGDDIVELHPGYSITGSVDAGTSQVEGPASDALRFAGDSGNGTFSLAALGTTYTDFEVLQKTGNSTWTLTGNGSGFTGQATVSGGRLDITGSLGSAVAVEAGATLGGSGSMGAVTVTGGTIAPGTSPGTMTVDSLALDADSVLDFELGTPDTVGGVDNDLIIVTNGLTLDGTLNVTGSPAFGNGVYTLIQYGTLVADNGLEPDTTPTGFDYAIGVGGVTNGAVTLTVSGGTAGGNQYWDGADTVADGTVDGGSGTWDDDTTNWTNAAGDANAAWGEEFAIFSGTAGTVTVDGTQAFTGLQFLTDGYTIAAGTGGELETDTAETDIRVGTGLTATISAPITGTGGLVKQEAGTLVLSGDSTYSGGTTILGGVVQVTGSLDGGSVVIDGKLEVQNSGDVKAITVFVGDAGDGELTISGGGALDTDAGFIAYQADSTGAVTVTGSGSSWTTSSLFVGNAGEGELSVLDGGTVSSAGGSIAVEAGSTGTVTVDGAGSTWVNSADVRIGQLDEGTLNVTDGGAVSNSKAFIGNSADATGSVTVSGTGSTWTNSDTLYVGNSGEGSLTISGGGTVSSSGGFIANAGSVTGTVAVSGTDSTWSNTGSLHVGNLGEGSLTISSGGMVSSTTVFIGTSTGSSGTINIGAADGDAAAAAGTLDTGDVLFSNGTGTIVFNHNGSAYDFTADMQSDGTGTHTIDHLAGTTTLSGDNSGFTGTTTVSGGQLNVTNALGGTLNVASGGTLGGAGTLGAVTVADGGTVAPGASPDTMTVDSLALGDGSVLDFELGTPGTVGGGVNDLIVVTNGLTLDGTVNVTDLPNFGNGVYTLIQYGSLVADNGLEVGTAPTGFVYDVGVGGATNDTVTLTVAGGNVGANQYWDGADTVADGTVDGGAGTWDAATTNWTNAAGDTNAAWGEEFAIFQGTAGTVTVDGTQTFTGMQFLTDGYVIAEGTDGELETSTTATSIRVGTGIEATISAPITGTGGIVKQEGGTLVLSGTNTYAGGTTVLGGLLQLAGNATLGSGAVVVGNGTTASHLNVTQDASLAGLDITVKQSATATFTDDSIASDTTIANSGTVNLHQDVAVDGAQLTGTAGSLYNIFFDPVTPQTRTIGSIAGAGRFALLDPDGILETGSADTSTTVSGTIEGDGGLTKIGTGTLTLTGANTYAGLTTVSGGTLSLGNGGVGGAVAGDIVNSAALIFNRSDDFSYAGVLSGTGSFTKLGAGIASLTGDSSGYAGAVGIDAGNLRIAAAAALGTTLLTVGTDGTLSGGGTVAGGLSVTGTVAPGASIGTLTVTGNATFDATSTFAVEVAADGSVDKLVATTATINGGTVEVTALDPGISYVAGTQSVIVDTTGGRTGTFNTLNDNSAFVEFLLDYSNANQVILEVAAVQADFTVLANTPNQHQAAGALAQFDQTHGSNALSVYNNILMLSGPQARGAFDMASGELHASGQHLIDRVHLLFSHLLLQQGSAGVGVGGTGNRIFATPAAQGPGAPAAVALGGAVDGRHLRGAWLAPLGAQGSVDGDGNAARLDWDAAGVAGGYQGPVDVARGEAFAGVALGYIHGDGEVDSRLSRMAASGFHAGVYGGWTDGLWTLSGSLAYAANRISTDRRIVFGAVNLQAEADYWSHSLGLAGEAAYEAYRVDGFTISPLGTLDVGWSGHDGFSESGAGALNLSGDSESWARFDTGLGLSLARSVATESGIVTLEARALWEHAFGDVLPDQALSFAGGPASFTVKGPDAGRNRLRIGAGVVYKLSEDLSVRGRYDGLFSGRQHSHGASVGANLQF